MGNFSQKRNSLKKHFKLITPSSGTTIEIEVTETEPYLKLYMDNLIVMAQALHQNYSVTGNIIKISCDDQAIADVVRDTFDPLGGSL